MLTRFFFHWKWLDNYVNLHHSCDSNWIQFCLCYIRPYNPRTINNYLNVFTYCSASELKMILRCVRCLIQLLGVEVDCQFRLKWVLVGRKSLLPQLTWYSLSLYIIFWTPMTFPSYVCIFYNFCIQFSVFAFILLTYFV